jgi:NTE family protein
MVMMAKRALVLGGGGVTGVAWEIGVLAGLAGYGLDLPAADLIVGTSAGSVVGAGVAAGEDLAEMYAGQLAPPDGQPRARLGAGNTARLVWVMVGTRDPVRARVKMGRLAQSAKTEPEAVRRAVFESLLAGREWPARLKVTAVDAQSGAFTVFDAGGSVTLLDAVGASCAVPGVWPPVTIAGHRYIDGGMRSATNADLAAGYDQVVIIAPIAQGFGHMISVGKQAAALAQAGARVIVISPDKAATQAIGRNVLDPARRAAAATAGRAQAAAEAGRVRAVWLPGVAGAPGHPAAPDGGGGPDAADQPG